MSYFDAIQIRSIDPNSGLLDAFGRQRVSESRTIFDSHQIFDDGDLAASVENFPQFWDNQETSGSGTSTAFDIDRASTTLSVGATTAGTRVRQSKRRMNYQPGKSQRILLTSLFGAAASGITRRYGLFDENNGLYLQQTNSGVSVVVRSYVSGAAVDTAVAQASWNIDPLDGSGDSGITLDLSKVQILFIDFEWLGVGSIRFGFVIDGVIYYAHQVNNANAITSVYMSTPNLPVRAEIINDGTGAASDFEVICAEVNSEGGADRTGVTRTHNTGITAITVASTATTYPILGVRLRSSHLGMQIDMQTVGFILTTSPDTILWSLQINPTLSGAASWSNLSLSGTQVATGNGTLTITTPGEIVASGYQTAAATSRGFQNTLADVNQKLGSLIDGTADTLWLCARPVDSTTDLLASMSWNEGL